MTAKMILLIFAIVCEALAALNVASPINLLALGLVCYLVSLLV